MLTTSERISLRDELFDKFKQIQLIYYNKRFSTYQYYNKKTLSKKLETYYPNILIEYKLYLNDFNSEEEALYCLLRHDDISNHLCPICGKPNTFYNLNHGYRNSCGNKKCIETIVQSDEAKKKRENTNLNRYGHKSSASSEQVKATMKANNLAKYGYESVSQIPEKKEKMKNTNRNKWGYDCTLQHPDIQAKAKASRKRKYGDENYNNALKAALTYFNEHGYTNPFLDPEVRIKSIISCLLRYGVDHPMKNAEIQRRQKESLYRNHGVEYALRSPELYAKFENKPLEYIEKIAELRNERILSTMRIHWIDNMYYHCVTRKWGAFSLHEEEMNTIDINNIRNIKKKENVITFDDKIHEYSFIISKSTLYKKFYISPLYTFDVQILEDPITLLEDLYNKNKNLLMEDMPTEWNIILPLYSVSWDSTLYVPERSGLNQRNARWRTRDPDEIYIPIPSWIYKKFPDFLPWRDVPFDLYLPDNTILSVKVCQDWWKALMSNPNKALWDWLLRKILRKDKWSLVKYLDLEMMWVDSVEISKRNWKFYINFKEIWKFEEFKNTNI